MASKLATAAQQGLDSLAQVFFPYASAIARNEDRSHLTEVAADGTRAAMFVGHDHRGDVRDPGLPRDQGVGRGRDTEPRPGRSWSLPRSSCSPRPSG